MSPLTHIPRLEPPGHELASEIKGDFSMVIAYDDLITRAPASKVCEPLLQQFGEEFDFQCTWWRYDFLKHPQLLAEAVEDAAHADVIIISAHADKGLPLAARDWIQKWAKRRLHQFSAVVALIGREEGSEADSGETEAYLRKLATDLNMDFFAKPFTYARQGSTWKEGEGESQAGGSAIPAEYSDDAPDVQSWGINE